MKHHRFSPQPRRSRLPFPQSKSFGRPEDLPRHVFPEAVTSNPFSRFHELELNDSDYLLTDQDRVGRLLSQAPPAEPPPWLVAKTMARIRSGEIGEAVRFSLWFKVSSFFKKELHGPRQMVWGGSLVSILVALLFVSFYVAPSSNIQEAFDLLDRANIEKSFSTHQTNGPISVADGLTATTPVQEAFAVVASTPASGETEPDGDADTF